MRGLRAVFTVFFMVTSAILVAGCTPFYSSHNRLAPEDMSANRLFQAYYVPKTLLRAVITSSNNNNNITLSTEKVPDSDYLFKVNYARSIIHDDDLEVETSAKGFLKSVKAHTSDASADIVEEFANILMSTIGRTPMTRKNRSLPKDALDQEHLLTVQLDPFDDNDFARKNKLLARRGYCIAVFGSDQRALRGSCMNGRRKGTRAVGRRGGGERATPLEGAGFFYRLPQQHKIEVYKKDKKYGWTPIWAGYDGFENESELLEIKVDRGAFIEQQADLTFTNGMLTTYTMKKPSELLGFLAIPSVVINTVVQIPGLQLGAQENEHKLKKRELDIRENEMQLRDRELKLRSVGVGAGNRQILVGPGVRGLNTGEAQTRAGDHATYMRRCRDQQQLSETVCQAMWLRDRNG